MKAQSPLRRLCRFSIRGLMLAVAAWCVLLGVVVNRVTAQRRSIESIDLVHGRVLYDFHEIEAGQFDPSRHSGVSNWLLSSFGVDYFHCVVRVDLDSPAVTNETLQQLHGLHHLRHIFIYESSITNDGLATLERLSELRTLSICNSSIDDDAMTHLSQLGGLQELVIENARVTDAGLLRLKDAVGLKKLLLDRTDVTEAGISELQRALPNCKIAY